MAIESDSNGADGRLAIKFYKFAELNKEATLAEGREIYKEVDYIKIVVPGDALSEIDRPVYESDKTRFPLQWANYLNRTSAEGKYEGTPLLEWALISRSQAEQLRAAKFYTVEQIASASDQQLQSIGMAAGMSPYTFRDKAQKFLDSAKTVADFSKREEELDQLRAENARIKAETDATMAAMKAENEAMKADFDAKLSSLLAAVDGKKPKAKKAETVEE